MNSLLISFQIEDEIQLGQTEVCANNDRVKDNSHVHGLINHHELHGFDANILHSLKAENEVQCMDCDKVCPIDI